MELPIIPDPVDKITTSFDKGELVIKITPPESKTPIVFYTAYFSTFKQKLLYTQTYTTPTFRIKQKPSMKLFNLRITATNEDKHESDPESLWKFYLPTTPNGNVL